MTVKMKKQICIVFCFVLFFIMTGCGNHVAEGRQENALSEVEVQVAQHTDNNEVSLETESQELTESVSEER